MNITRITKFEDSPDLADWNRLTDDSPFRQWEWLSAWCETFGAERELMVLLVHNESNDLVAIAPWYVHQSKTRGRVVRFLGDGKACSDYMSILVDEKDAVDAVAAIGRWMAASGRGENGPSCKWNVLDFDGVVQADPTLSALMNAIGVESDVLESPCEHTWVVPLQSSWDEYLAARGKRRRNMLRKITKNFIASERAEIQFVETEADYQEFLTSLIRLHTMRRQDLGCDGCFAHDRFADFLTKATRRLFDVGKLWMTQLKIDGEVAANAVGVRDGNTLYLYQCGFDPKFSECRPGWIQNIFTLQKAIEEGIESIDFLRGDELYKSQLGGEPTTLVRLRVSAPTVVAKVRNTIALVAANIYHAMPLKSN